MKTKDGPILDVRCNCNVCNGHLIVPAGHAGETIICPHCRMETVLYEPPCPTDNRPAELVQANLETCADCGQSISGRAEVRPHCGAPQRRRRSVFYVFAGRIGLILTCIILALVVTLLSLLANSHQRRELAEAKAKAGVPPDVQLSDIQMNDLKSGHIFSPAEIQAIRSGRTAGFGEVTSTPAENAAGRLVKILNWNLGSPKKTEEVVSVPLSVTLTNPVPAWGRGEIWLIGYNLSRNKSYEDIQSTGLAPGTKETKIFTFFFEPAEWESSFTWEVLWKPEGSSTSLVLLSDFVDLPSLANRLKQPNRLVDTWLEGQLSVATLATLARYKGQDTDRAALQTSLAQDLNSIISGASIYDPQRFADVGLRSETRMLLPQNPQGDNLLRLNRLLIEDAYPLELSKR